MNPNMSRPVRQFALILLISCICALGLLTGCEEDAQAYKTVAMQEMEAICHPSAEHLKNINGFDPSSAESKMALDIMTIIAPATKYELGEPVKVEKDVYDVPVTITLIPINNVSSAIADYPSRMDPNNPPKDEAAIYDLIRKYVKEDFEAEKFKPVSGLFTMRVKKIDGVIQSDPNDPANKPLFDFYLNGTGAK